MTLEETLEEAHIALQASLMTWSDILITTGGSLTPKKCFYFLIGFQLDCNGNGHWSYWQNHNDHNFDTYFKLSAGSLEHITHFPVNKELVTPGVASRPSGDATTALQQTKDKAKQWATSAASIHFAVQRKF